MTEYFNSKYAENIEKLGRLNYLQWANRMRAYLSPLDVCASSSAKKYVLQLAETAAHIKPSSRKTGRHSVLSSARAPHPWPAIHAENLGTSSDMWKALAGVSNSTGAGTGRSLLYRRFTSIKAIPGDPPGDFFGKLQETVGLLADTDHAIPPR